MTNRDKRRKFEKAKFKTPEATAAFRFASRIEKIEKISNSMYFRKNMDFQEYLKHRKKVLVLFKNLDKVIGEIEEEILKRIKNGNG